MGNPEKEPPSPPSLPRRCRAGLLLLCFGLFFASSSGSFLGNQDTIFMWGVARELSRTGSLAVAPEVLSLQPGNFDHLRGKDGRHYFPKGMSYSLALVPFCWMGDVLAFLKGAPDDPVQRARYGMLGASAAGPLFAALEVLLIFELCRLAWGLRLATLAALGAGLGTLLWSNSKSGFSEPFMGLLLTFQLYCLARYHRDPSPRWPFLLGTAFALLFLSQPAMAALVGPPLSGLVVWTAWRTHRLGLGALARAALAFGLPVAAGLAVFGWINVLRYGEVTETGYWSFVGRYVPLYEGVYGVLFSPGKSLFLYSPVLVFAVFGIRPWLRRIGPAALFPAALLLLFLGLYGVLPTWHGDGAWGPRYFSPLTGPLAVLAAGFVATAAGPARRRREIAWIALVALGAMVQGIGVTTSTAGYFGLLIENGVLASNGDTGQPAWKPVLFDPRLSPVPGRARLLASRVRTWVSGEGGTWTTRLADGTRATVKLSGYDILDLWPARGSTGVSPGMRKAMLAAWIGLLGMAAAGGLLLLRTRE